jgi:Ca2+-binding RTX toxin-like protein
VSEIYGTDTNDIIYAGIDNDSLYGGLGADRLSGGYGNDSLFGELSSNTVYLDQYPTMLANANSDYLIGGAGNDSLLDEFGNNRLSGGSGDDIIVGVGSLYGGAGRDYVANSFQGHADLYGGQGADHFGILLNAIPEQFVPGAAPTQSVIKDFHPREGDRISINMQDTDGRFYGADGFGNGSAKDIVTLLDDNHDNKLTASDTWVNPTADGKGIELIWWNSTLTIEHTTSISSDWIV